MMTLMPLLERAQHAVTWYRQQSWYRPWLAWLLIFATLPLQASINAVGSSLSSQQTSSEIIATTPAENAQPSTSTVLEPSATSPSTTPEAAATTPPAPAETLTETPAENSPAMPEAQSSASDANLASPEAHADLPLQQPEDGSMASAMMDEPLSFQGIREHAQLLDREQWRTFRQVVIGEQVNNWQGWVKNVEEEADAFILQIDMDRLDDSGRLYDIEILGLAREQAQRYRVGDRITFSGIIHNIISIPDTDRVIVYFDTADGVAMR